VKSEIHAQLGLHSTEYILQVSEKWTNLTRDHCSLADYNIHKNTTLDIKLLHPMAEPRFDHGLLGGTEDDIEVEVEEPASNAGGANANDNEIPELPDDPSRDPLFEWRVSDLVRLLTSKGLPVGERITHKLVKRIREAEANGWQKKRPKSSRERKVKSRSKRSHNKIQEDNAKNAKSMANTRADKKNASVHNWPRMDTLLGETPGKDYKVQYHTDDVMAALYLLHLESGGWMYRESMWLIAYLHVMKRLAEADDSCIRKLNGLLELSIERYSTLYKTLYQEVLDDNDLKQVCKWKGQTEHRQLMDRKEAVLEWFAGVEGKVEAMW